MVCKRRRTRYGTYVDPRTTEFLCCHHGCKKIFPQHNSFVLRVVGVLVRSVDYETDMTLLFVPATTGRALRDQIVTASEKNSYHAGLSPPTRGHANETSLDESALEDDRFFGYNLVVEIDGTSPYYESGYRGLNMAAYFLVRILLELGLNRTLESRLFRSDEINVFF